MKNKYQCEFNLRFHDYYLIVTSDNGINIFKDGFWINEKYELTTGDDCKYWIPPSKINFIKKIKGE